MINQILIQQTLAGNQKAFNFLAHRWQNPIYNYCLRFVGNADIAKDVLQLVLLKIYQKLETLEDHSKFSTWVFQIARNLCLDEIKKKKFEEITEEIESISNNNDPLQVTTQNDITAVLSKALQKIPEDQREVIVLKTYHDLKFIEIAEMLNISINTVKSRMYSGLKSLRPHIDQFNLNEE